MRPSEAVDQDRLSSVDDVVDELQDRPEPRGQLASGPTKNFSSPEGDIKDVIVKTVLVETLDVGGAVDNSCNASVLQTLQISRCLDGRKV